MQAWLSAGVPVSVRRVTLIAAGVLGYGAVVHVVHLVLGGWNPYPSLPALTVYFVSLTLLNPRFGRAPAVP